MESVAKDVVVEPAGAAVVGGMVVVPGTTDDGRFRVWVELFDEGAEAVFGVVPQATSASEKTVIPTATSTLRVCKILGKMVMKLFRWMNWPSRQFPPVF